MGPVRGPGVSLGYDAERAVPAQPARVVVGSLLEGPHCGLRSSVSGAVQSGYKKRM